LSGKKYICQCSSTPSPQEKVLFSKYYEPTIEVGGAFTDGTTSFDITEQEKKVFTDSPIGQVFDTVSLGITYTEAGTRAKIFLDEIVDRIETEMDTLRAIDLSTNQELDSVVIV
jgi:hypothetical protein